MWQPEYHQHLEPDTAESENMHTARVGKVRQIGQDLIQPREQQEDGNAQQHYDQILPETRW